MDKQKLIGRLEKLLDTKYNDLALENLSPNVQDIKTAAGYAYLQINNLLIAKYILSNNEDLDTRRIMATYNYTVADNALRDTPDSIIDYFEYNIKTLDSWYQFAYKFEAMIDDSIPSYTDVSNCIEFNSQFAKHLGVLYKRFIGD